MSAQQHLSLLIGLLSPITALILLGMQVYTFLKTRHPSTLILTVSSLAGIACWVLIYLQWIQHVPDGSKAILVLAGFALLMVQCISGIWGSAALFRAFRHFVSSSLGSPSPSTVFSPPRLEPIAATADSADMSATVRVADLWRLWCLRRPRYALRPSDRAVFLLAAVAVLGWIGLDKWGSGADSRFMAWGIPGIGCYVLLALSVAYVTARASAPRLPFRTTIYVVSAVSPALVLVAWAADFMLPESAKTAASILLFSYVLVYSAVALRHLVGTWQVPATALVALVLVGYYFADQHIYWSASVWLPAPAVEADYPASHATAETLLFDQRSRIDEAVQAMHSPGGEEPGVYFVGFAGYGDQRVFGEEIKLAAHTVAARFDVGDRQLLLINDRRDIVHYPIATGTSLAYALKLLGGKMDRKRDILFLALSSHGSSSPLLSVTNGPVSLEQLSGERLRAALDASGIERRIIVISACHAGAFVPALSNANSIIITAAAADKTSFGCSDDRDLTYFGEAFYRDALPKAANLRGAFEDAKRAIGLREQQEHQTASDPQAYFGSELQGLLDQHPMTVPRAQ